MDIATKLSDLRADLSQCRRAITYRGGEISATAGFKEVSERISSLPASSSIGTVIDEDVSIQKTVPVDSTKYCYLKSLGGMTYKCNNLLTYPYSQTTFTRNGITFTDNGDGTITVNGTAESRVSFSFKNKSFTLPKGKYYASICPSGGSLSTYHSFVSVWNNDTWVTEVNDIGNGVVLDVTNRTYTELRVSIYIEAGTVCNNLVVKPMLNAGTTALPYEDYYEGLRDTKPTAIKVSGANLLDFEAALKYWRMSYTKEGNSLTTNASFSNAYSYPYKFTDNASICTISLSSVSVIGLGGARIDIGYINEEGSFTRKGVLTLTGENISYTSTSEANAIRLNFSSATGEAISVTFNELRINRGSASTPYQPYHEPITYPIPEALQGTGKGVEGAIDTIDFENGKQIIKTHTVVFNGTETWHVGGTKDGKYRNYTKLPFSTAFTANDVAAPLICNLYDAVSESDTYSRIKGASISPNGYIRIYDSLYDTGDISLWKAHLAELYASGNPITVTYALAEPTETDIDTSSFDNLIEVEGGCSLEIITDNGKEVPTTFIYQTIV